MPSINARIGPGCLLQPSANRPRPNAAASAAGDAIVFVCWAHQSELASAHFPQRLGVVFCFNRPCDLRAVAWPQPASAASAAGGASVLLTSHRGSAFSPRFSPDGSTLVFLSQQNAIATGVHSATATLHSLAWADARATLDGGMPPPARTGATACSHAPLAAAVAASVWAASTYTAGMPTRPPALLPPSRACSCLCACSGGHCLGARQPRRVPRPLLQRPA